MTTSAQIVSFGSDNNGQLGDGILFQQISPVAVITSSVLGGKNISSVSAGNDHSIALDSNGKVYSWGNNIYGQLGDGTTTQRNSPVAIVTSGVLNGKTIIAISTGNFHSIALDS